MRSHAERCLRDHTNGASARDPGIPAVVDAAIEWLCAAQDRSKSNDGGVARDYSLLADWASSYPETTGYIIPTFLAHWPSAKSMYHPHPRW